MANYISSRRQGGRRPSEPILVIGYGNELRSDDGAGIRAAAILATQSLPLRVILTTQLTPDLAEDMLSAKQVVFVDAYAAPESGASLRVEKIFGVDAKNSSVIGHYGNPAALVRLAEELFGVSLDAWIVGIPAYSFVAGEIISPETSYWIDEAVALIGERASSGKWKGSQK